MKKEKHDKIQDFNVILISINKVYIRLFIFWSGWPVVDGFTWVISFISDVRFKK